MFRKTRHFAIFVAAFVATLAMASQAAAVTTPYIEDFELEANQGGFCSSTVTLAGSGWTNDTTDDRDWSVDNGGTGSPGTGPSVDHNPGTPAGKYLYTETSSPCDAAQGVYNLISPVLTLTGNVNPVVRFWYHQLGDDHGQLHVDVLDTNFNVLALDVTAPLGPNNANVWVQSPKISLAGFLAQGDVHVRLRYVHSGTGFEGDTAVDDFEFVNDPAPDAAALSVDGPDSCGLGNMEAIVATFQNQGGTVIQNIPVSYTINGGTPVSEVLAGPLNPGQSVQYTFATTADLSAFQAYNIDVAIALPGDTSAGNDQASRGIVNAAAFTAPFTEDFEGASATANWFVGGTNSSWALGTPNGTVINAAASGTNAYATNLGAGYNNNEFGFIQTACPIDLSVVTDPVVSLNIWYDSDTFNDGTQVQYSLNGGLSWLPIGTSATSTAGVNWYNDTDVDGIANGADGWAGDGASGSQGYVNAVHLLDNISNETSVLFRVVFGSTGFTVSGNGVAIDDFGIQPAANALPQDVTVAQSPAPAPTQGGRHITHAPFTVLELDFDTPAGAVQIDSITVTNTGTIMDSDIYWHLFADDGDGVFDIATDTQLANMVSQTAGAATLTTGMFNTLAFGTQRMFIVAELAPTAMVGDTIIAAIAADADIVFGGTPNVTIAAPYNGDTFNTIDIINTFPFEDDFSMFSTDVSIDSLAGADFAEAPGVGPVTGGTSFDEDAQVQLVASQGALAPVMGTNFLQVDWPAGFAGVGVQYAFDMSAYSVMNEEHVWVQFRWAQVGEEDQAQEHVFLSLDGGGSIVGSIFDFDMGLADETWFEENVDLYDVLTNASLDYTDNVVLRFQASDNFPIPSDGFFMDWVKVGLAPEIALERDGNVFLNSDTDMAGNIPALPQTFTYTVMNGGDYDLVIDPAGFSVTNDMGVSNVMVTQPANLTIAPGSMETLVVAFDPGVGPFSFNIEAIANGPAIGGGPFSITVDGTGEVPANEILVERPVGTEIASGSTDSQGNQMVGMQQELTYVITNTGNIDLNISGVTIANESNATATVSVAPMGVLAAQETTTFAVQYTASAAGAFSFDIEIANDDTDENPYIITVDGTGEDMGGVGGGGPASTGAGGDDTGAGGGTGGDDANPVDAQGGCSCSTPGDRRDDSPLGMLAMAGLALAATRRRRR